MKSRATVSIIIALLALTLTVPVWAGGWAVITLDEVPRSIVAGETVTVRFAVRQHGRTLLPGLDATIQAENRDTGETIHVSAEPVEDQAGNYQAALTFPSEGRWEWRIQAFSANQPMPDLTVVSKTEIASPPPVKTNPLPVAAGYGGLILAAVAAGIAIRLRARWALALVLVGLLAGGAGFALATGSAQAEKKPVPELPSGSTQTENPVQMGQALFVAKGCVTCHANRNIERRFLDIHVDIGPDLTGYAAAPEYLRMWLKDPAAVKPDTEMPNLELKEAEIEALIVFLNEASESSSQESQGAPPAAHIVTATPAQTVANRKEQTCSEAKPGSSTLVGTSDQKETRFQLLDPGTGFPLCGYQPISPGFVIQQMYLPGMNALLAASAESPTGQDTHLNWIDLATWQSNDLGVTLPAWTSGMAVNQAGTRIVAIYPRLTSGPQKWLKGYSLVLIDKSRKATLQEKELDFDPRLVEYIAGGKLIVMYGVKNDYVKGTSISPGLVRLLDAGDLSTVWEVEVKGVLEGMQRNDIDGPTDQFVLWSPVVVLSHDREQLYVVHADADRLTTVDLVNHAIQTVNIQPRLSWIERLLRLNAGVAHAKFMDGTIKQGVLSPDSTLLYVTGFTGATDLDAPNGRQFQTFPLGLQVIRLEDGKEMARFTTQAREIDISTDGSYLFLRGWVDNQAFTEVYATNGLELVANLEDQLLVPARTLDGESLILSRPEGQYEGSINLLDRHTFKIISSLNGKSDEAIFLP